MKKINLALVLFLLVVSLSGAGCVKQYADPESRSENSNATSQYTAINGKAEETLDGFYVNGYLLEDKEISKYKPDYQSEDYADKMVELVGKVKEVETVCEPFTECREGKYKVIYDVQSITIK